MRWASPVRRAVSLALAISTFGVAQNNGTDHVKRDLIAENGVAEKFTKLRQVAELPLYGRLDGANFAAVACRSAHNDVSEEQRFEDSSSIAFIYSSNEPESNETLAYISSRPWKHVRHLVVGVCHGRTATFPQGRYWVAIGLVGNHWDKFLTEMSGGTLKK